MKPTEVFDLRSADDIDLMSLAVTAAESWKILLIGPVLVAIVAFGISRFLPEQYESVVAAELSEKGSQVLTAPGGVDLILSWPELSVQAPRATELARFRVSARNALTGVVDIAVRSSNPQLTQSLVSEIVRKVAAKAASENDAAAKQIQSKVDAFSQQNESLGKMVETLTKNGPPTASSDPTRNDSGGFAEAILRATSQIRDNQVAIAAFNEDLAKMRKPPVLAAITPVQPVNHNGVSTSILCFTLSLFAAVIFVYGREAFRKASSKAEVAAKLARIRRAFWKSPS